MKNQAPKPEQTSAVDRAFPYLVVAYDRWGGCAGLVHTDELEEARREARALNGEVFVRLDEREAVTR